MPPKPRNIKSSPSPKKSSPEINGVSHVTHSKCNTNGDTPVKMQVKENTYPTDKTENGMSKGNLFLKITYQNFLYLTLILYF